MRRLAARAAAHWPASVTAAFLDFNLPSVPGRLRGLAVGAGRRSWCRLLLTSAYHGRVDLPEVLAAAGRGGAADGRAGAGRAGRRARSTAGRGACAGGVRTGHARYDGAGRCLAAGTSRRGSSLHCGVCGVGAVRGPVTCRAWSATHRRLRRPGPRPWRRCAPWARGGSRRRRTSWPLGGSTTPLRRRRAPLVSWVWPRRWGPLRSSSAGPRPRRIRSRRGTPRPVTRTSGAPSAR